MIRKFSSCFVAFQMILAVPAFSEEQTYDDRKILDSIVVGLVAHNIQSDDADGVDLNLELRFNLPLGLPEEIELLPTVGAVGHFADDGASLGYLGATLRYQHSSGVFAEGFFGFAAHTADTPVDSGEADLGCEVLFREAAEIGYARQRHRVGVHVSHYSHGGILCDEDENDGLTQVGVRYGYQF